MRYTASEKLQIIQRVEQSALPVAANSEAAGDPEVDVLRLVSALR